MSRKSGKPPRKNPFLQKDRDQLLDELSSIQDMLGEAGEDVDEAGIPTLAAEGDAAPVGDAENQIPLLAPDDTSDDTPNEANERLRNALKERENPFLSGAARAADNQKAPRKAESAPQPSPQPAPEAAPEPPAEPPAEPPPPEAARLDEQQMRALVDEVLAAWLPKIERELRARLMDYLRGQ